MVLTIMACSSSGIPSNWILAPSIVLCVYSIKLIQKELPSHGHAVSDSASRLCRPLLCNFPIIKEELSTQLRGKRTDLAHMQEYSRPEWDTE